jgi:hypothetical protein
MAAIGQLHAAQSAAMDALEYRRSTSLRASAKKEEIIYIAGGEDDTRFVLERRFVLFNTDAIPADS